jgi:hypothetical protein
MSALNQVSHWTASMRGTPAYWSSQAKRGHAFVAFLEYNYDQMPTVFNTTSAAELHWEFVHRLLPGHEAYLNRDDITDQDAYRLRAEAVVKNPGIVAFMFYHFYHKWTLDVMYSHGEWEDHFARFEFAARGLTHAHTIARMRGAPTITAIEETLLEIQQRGDSDGPLATALMAWYKDHVGLTALMPMRKQEDWPEAAPGYDPEHEGSGPAKPDSKCLRTPLHKVPADAESRCEHLGQVAARTILHACSTYCLVKDKRGKAKGDPAGEAAVYCRCGYGPDSELRRPCVCKECSERLQQRTAEDVLTSADPPPCAACDAAAAATATPSCW